MITQKPIRLNKAIASCGLCSRRAADELIASGKVKVNGKTVTDYSLLVNLQADKLTVADKKIFASSLAYIILNKPKSVISTCKDEYSRKNILDLIPRDLRHLKPAGRLDYDSSGLILLTNDGELINRLTHPKSEIEKTYKVVVAGKMTAQALDELTNGICLNEAKTKSARVRVLKDHEEQSIIEIIIKEGKNRQVRRMCAQLGLPVVELVRTGVSKLQLGKLPVGKWRHLTKSELIELQKDLKISNTLNTNNEFRRNRTKTKIGTR